MKNIIDILGTDHINRIRIGIANDRTIDTVDYVLGRFSREDMKTLDGVFERGADAIIYSFDHDFDKVMNRYNG